MTITSHRPFYVCVCVGLWITCRSPGAMMLKMDRNSVILVSLLAVTSQKQADPKMPAWSMSVGHTDTNKALCNWVTLYLHLHIISDLCHVALHIPGGSPSVLPNEVHSFKTDKDKVYKYQILNISNCNQTYSQKVIKS